MQLEPRAWTLRESELIGLCPLAALVEVADHIGAPADSAR